MLGSEMADETMPDEEMPMHDDQSGDDEMMDMVADELQQALEKKDKKGILEAIRALVLSCRE